MNTSIHNVIPLSCSPLCVSFYFCSVELLDQTKPGPQHFVTSNSSKIGILVHGCVAYPGLSGLHNPDTEHALMVSVIRVITHPQTKYITMQHNLYSFMCTVQILDDFNRYLVNCLGKVSKIKKK